SPGRRACVWPGFAHAGPRWAQEVPDGAAGVNATGSASRLAAMRADAGDLDHWRFRHEAGSARGRCQRRGDVLRGRLSHCAAALANQKYHERSGGGIVYASDEGIAAFDPMHEPVLTEELERSVGPGRRPARSLY